MRYLLKAAVLLATLGGVLAAQGRPPGGPDKPSGEAGEEVFREDEGEGSSPSDQDPCSEESKGGGTVMVVGGGKLPDGVRDRFLELAGGKRARLVVIPTAGGQVDSGEVPPSYLLWRAQDVESVELLHTRDRRRANDPSFVKPLESATGVWIAGGDQSRLTAAYQGTAVLRELGKVLERGGVVAGTSAGASVMSAVMITGGTTRAELGSGFGLVPGLVVDQHFANRNRLGRLLGVLDRHPDLVGVGVDEQTAAVLHGPTLSVVGDANVWVCKPAGGALPASVERLRSGDHVDLAGPTHSLVASHPAPEALTVAAAGAR
jgi:cyanophycinase